MVAFFVLGGMNCCTRTIIIFDMNLSNGPMKNNVIFTFLCCLSLQSMAGVADIEVSVSSQRLDRLQYGDIGQFSITITNFGPDAAGADSSLDKPIVAFSIIEVESDGAPLHFIQDTSIPQSCDFLLSFGEPVPPNPLAIAYSFYFEPIPVGESITCYGFFLVLFDNGTRTVEWQISSGLFDTDPNKTNNIQAMIFGSQPIAVSTASFLGMVLLSVFVMLIGMSYIKKFMKFENRIRLIDKSHGDS